MYMYVHAYHSHNINAKIYSVFRNIQCISATHSLPTNVVLCAHTHPYTMYITYTMYKINCNAKFYHQCENDNA